MYKFQQVSNPRTKKTSLYIFFYSIFFRQITPPSTHSPFLSQKNKERILEKKNFFFLSFTIPLSSPSSSQSKCCARSWGMRVIQHHHHHHHQNRQSFSSKRGWHPVGQCTLSRNSALGLSARLFSSFSRVWQSKSCTCRWLYRTGAYTTMMSSLLFYPRVAECRTISIWGKFW